MITRPVRILYTKIILSRKPHTTLLLRNACAREKRDEGQRLVTRIKRTKTVPTATGHRQRDLRRGRCRGTQTLSQRRPEGKEEEEEDNDRNVVGGCPGGATRNDGAKKTTSSCLSLCASRETAIHRRARETVRSFVSVLHCDTLAC